MRDAVRYITLQPSVIFLFVALRSRLISSLIDYWAYNIQRPLRNINTSIIIIQRRQPCITVIKLNIY